MIYIVRHGQTDKNVEKVLQGRSDFPLNNTGREQAREIAAYFKKQGICFDKIYSSPLKRATETASIIAGENHKILTDTRLLEMDYGPYEGVSLSSPPKEIQVFFQDFVNNKAPEGMESLDQVVARMGNFISDLSVEQEENILIATHAIAMKGFLEYLTPDSKGSYWSKFIGNCAIYRTDFKDGVFTIPTELL